MPKIKDTTGKATKGSRAKLNKATKRRSGIVDPFAGGTGKLPKEVR